MLEALLFSPVCGFVLAGLLLLALKLVVRNPKLYQAPEGLEPPPLLIRGLLVLTCTAVSFAHGGNDMYLAADAVQLLPKAGAAFPAEEAAVLKSYQSALYEGTRYIPMPIPTGGIPADVRFDQETTPRPGLSGPEMSHLDKQNL